MTDEERKKAFAIRVLAWSELRNCHGSWSQAAKFYDLQEHELMRMCLDDLETTWGDKLDWEKAYG